MAITKGERIVCQNKKAYHDYFISDTLEAGIVLVGTEIKSLRAGKASLQDSYCEVIDGEMFLRGLHISKYEMGQLKEIVHKVDPNAFMIVHEAHQVLGDGFSRYADDKL